MEGEWLVQRQVLWKVPEEVLKGYEEEEKGKKKQAWNLADKMDQSRGEVSGGGGKVGGVGGRVAVGSE